MFNSLGPSDMEDTNNLFGVSAFGERRVLPSCVLWTIRGTFPEEDATYIPYNEGDLDWKYDGGRHSEMFLNIVAPEKSTKSLKDTFE